MSKTTLRKTVDALRQCSATMDGKLACDGCFRHCLTEPRLEILDDAAAALSRFMWRDPETDPPPFNKRILVAREYIKGQPLIVEQAYKDVGDWWRVYGTRVKKIVAWMPMPEPPVKGED